MGAVATYVNGSTWCGSNCAHVKYWEIWNEFTRNSINPSQDPSNPPPAHASWFSSQDSTYGCNTKGKQPCPTVDQLIRMTEDARCVITGLGTVDNYPSAGTNTLCSDLQNPQGNYKWPPAIDATAEIVQPSVTYPGKADALGSLTCFLYCGTTQHTCQDWNSNPQCKNTNGWPHAASAVDILNFHGYTLSGSQNPEVFFPPRRETAAFPPLRPRCRGQKRVSRCGWAKEASATPSRGLVGG